MAEAGPSHPPAAAAPQWRQFSFFDLEEVKDVEDLASSPKFFKDLSPPILLAPTSADSPLPPSIIVSSGQTLTVLDRHFQPLTSWAAWDGNGRATHIAEAAGLVLVIGEEEGVRHPILKIWDLTREEKKRKGGGPVLMRNTKIQHGQRPHPVSAIALSTTLSHLAIGLGDGTVLLYRHLLQSLTTSPTSLTALPKARVIHESPEPVTALGFREARDAGTSTSKAPDTAATASGNPLLFIFTVNRVLVGEVSSRSGQARTIDDLGCGLGCAVPDWQRQGMIMARDEAVYLYHPEGQGDMFAHQGPKSSISVFKNNLIVVSPPFVPSASSNSATVRQYVAKTGGGDSSRDIAKVTIFDLQNKIIAYSGTFKDGVREVFSQWGDVFVLSSNGKLSRLDEHSTQAKLDVLHRRNMYTLSLDLAKNSGMSESGLADIHKKYGDYLYGKGDYDGSINQFVKTLGSLQPSYVIRKFLDAQLIQNLTVYLQSLHSHNLATPDHTTLLLNCYLKTGDKSALDDFIKTETRRADEAGGGLDDLPFDLDTAIRVCRQAGFFEHATYLARKYGRHEDFLRVQIEDAEKYGDALNYLRGLGPVACQENMMIYGRTLLQHAPEETTELLIDLCSGTLGKTPTREAPTEDTARINGSAGPAVLSYLGYNRVAGMFTSEPQTSSSPTDSAKPPTQVNGERSGSRITQMSGKSDISRAQTREATDVTSTDAAVEFKPSYTPPSPRRYFAHFIDHHDLFVHFLESVALTLWGQEVDTSGTQMQNTLAPPPAYDTHGAPSDPVDEDQRAVWNTLLELYLASTSASDPAVSTLARKKVMGLLSSDSLPHDQMHALLLCSTLGFTDGMVHLWERMGMYEDVLRYWMSAPTRAVTSDSGSSGHPSDEVLRCLRLYGPANPHLYPLVLRYLTSSPEVLIRQAGQLGGILRQIDEEHIMPPLAVVQLLSRNGVASVGNVKEWLREKVAESRQDVESDKSLVQSYRSETTSKSAQITSLANPTQPEIFQVTRCASCSQQLDLPAVHFMCKHSYHQRCLSDSDPECILCARQHAIIREVRRNQTRLAGRHELFVSEVEEAEDGFGVVAGAFSRGLMGLRVEG